MKLEYKAPIVETFVVKVAAPVAISPSISGLRQVNIKVKSTKELGDNSYGIAGIVGSTYRTRINCVYSPVLAADWVQTAKPVIPCLPA